ncbi:hypothetical protein ACIQPR_47250 [Streptomyces sp. NPDC091280]|uniref:hypothetical protein n=1 Tax=Streptomyces sp. NPDC091280 TaxID=3365984 RepID=UPI0037F42B39
MVEIFPDRTALIFLVDAFLAGQDDEWAEARHYMGIELLAKVSLPPVESQTHQTVPPTGLTA